MQYKEVLEILQLFHGLSVEEMVWETETGRLELKKTATRPAAQAVQKEPAAVAANPVTAPAPAQAVANETVESAPEDRYVTAPLVGVFYMQAGPGRPPFVQVGDTVHKGQTLCIIEAMKMMNEITAEVDGVIEEVLGENGQMVEFGQNLFKIRAA